MATDVCGRPAPGYQPRVDGLAGPASAPEFPESAGTVFADGHTGNYRRMSGPFSDDVPIDDAMEQQQPVADPAPADGPDGAPPLESDPGDWQEQRQALDELDPDEERR